MSRTRSKTFGVTINRLWQQLPYECRIDWTREGTHLLKQRLLAYICSQPDNNAYYTDGSSDGTRLAAVVHKEKEIPWRCGICWLNGGGHQSASGPGCRLDGRGGYHRPVCIETVVGPLHHYRRRGGSDNNNNKSLLYLMIRHLYWTLK